MSEFHVQLSTSTASKVKLLTDIVKGLPFNRIYNAFHRVVSKHVDLAVQKSADRYINALQGTRFNTWDVSILSIDICKE